MDAIKHARDRFHALAEVYKAFDRLEKTESATLPLNLNDITPLDVHEALNKLIEEEAAIIALIKSLQKLDHPRSQEHILSWTVEREERFERRKELEAFSRFIMKRDKLGYC